MSDILKLQARDAEDVAVVSAILQDAIVAVRDMAYDAAAKQFMVAASRFCWESVDLPQPVYERVTCVVTITGVTAVQMQQIDQTAKGALHELLAVMLEEGALRLVFAGGAQLRLAVQDWQMQLQDFGARWPTEKCPQHEQKSVG